MVSVRLSNSLDWVLLVCWIRSLNRASITCVRYDKLLWSATVSSDANSHLGAEKGEETSVSKTRARGCKFKCETETNKRNSVLVVDTEALLLLQSVHHRSEEELVLDQLGQALAAAAELNLHHILISGGIKHWISDRVRANRWHRRQWHTCQTLPGQCLSCTMSPKIHSEKSK